MHACTRGPHLPESGELSPTHPGAVRRDPRGAARRPPATLNMEFLKEQKEGPAANCCLNQRSLSHDKALHNLTYTTFGGW